MLKRRAVYIMTMWVLGCSLLLNICLGHADEQPTPTKPDRLFAAGLIFEQRAEIAKSPAEAVDLLKKAIGQFDQATQLQPDFASAHALWTGAEVTAPVPGKTKTDAGTKS